MCNRVAAAAWQGGPGAMQQVSRPSGVPVDIAAAASAPVVPGSEHPDAGNRCMWLGQSRHLLPGSSHQRMPEQAERWIPDARPRLSGSGRRCGLIRLSRRTAMIQDTVALRLVEPRAGRDDRSLLGEKVAVKSDACLRQEGRMRGPSRAGTVARSPVRPNDLRSRFRGCACFSRSARERKSWPHVLSPEGRGDAGGPFAH
jgi:hypothetical protein